MFGIKVCWWLDSNRGPVASEVTAVPTEPQPLPILDSFVDVVSNETRRNISSSDCFRCLKATSLSENILTASVNFFNKNFFAQKVEIPICWTKLLRKCFRYKTITIYLFWSILGFPMHAVGPNPVNKNCSIIFCSF